MAVQTREELKEYCLRKLGKPVININVDDTQLEDRIDEALETYTEKHYDATIEQWVSYKLTQTDIDNGYIPIPDDILVVLNIMPVHQLIAHNNMFSYQYQIAVNQLSPWQPFDQVDYFMKIMNYESVMDLTSVTPTFSFSRHQKRLYVNENLGNLGVDYPFGMRVQKIVDPEGSGNTVYNDKWLKEYTCALFKRQWGENMKKFSGVQMLGGVELNGQQLFDEAMEELQQLEETLQDTYMEPISFFVG